MTDMVLPGRSGKELCRDLRSVAPEVVILLNSGEAEPAADPLEPGIYYLAKPYTRKTLVEKIEEIFVATPRRRAVGHAGSRSLPEPPAWAGPRLSFHL